MTSIIRHNIPIVYVDVENSTRWTIAYVDISAAPYKINFTVDNDFFETSDLLEHFDISKVLLEESYIYDTTTLQWESFTSYIDEVIIEEQLILTLNSNTFDEFNTIEELVVYSNKVLLEEFTAQDFNSLNLGFTQEPQEYNIYDSAYLSPNVGSLDTFTQTDSNYKNTRIVISNLLNQDYYDPTYLEWSVSGTTDWQQVYNNTIGKRDSVTMSDNTIISKNGSQVYPV